ncbi:hypothetical protein RhiirA4_550409 [Rhizophagus irregularis]|uniref:Uncharacterized protein n=2 Tax=Rhizophagus irregularis TaxID=588596 RepID=A0A2I1HL70_9GLOM|nr:hypothetical protein RhiirA4_550409 [Rhizophagus irregularis]
MTINQFIQPDAKQRATAGMVKRYFCTPSKANVMIVTLLWLVQGIFIIKKAIEYSLKLNLSNIEIDIKLSFNRFILKISDKSCLSHSNFYYLWINDNRSNIWIIDYKLCGNNKSMMLFLYSKLACVIAKSNVVGTNILTIVEIVFHGSKVLEECQNLNHLCNHEYYYTRTISDKCQDLGYVCNQKYFDIIQNIILYAFISIILSLYSAMIISGYAYKIRDKEEIKRVLQEMITKT